MRRLRVLLVALAAMAAGSAAAAQEGRDPLDRLVGEFGTPIVLVEAERPEHPDDRRAVALLAKSLAARGLRCADGQESRTRRRELADAAVGAGSPAAAARAALDRPDADFVVRVGSATKDAGSATSYGIEIAALECTLTLAVLRFADQSALEVGAAAAVARSKSAAAAAQEAEAAAAEDASARIAEAAFADWRAIAAGRRPWIVEIVSPSEGDAERLAGSVRDARVVILENRPGVRSLVAIPSDGGSPPCAGLLPGKEILRRPGYLMVAMPAPPAVPSHVLIAAALAAGAAFVLAGAAVARRVRGRVSVTAPGAVRG